MDQTNKLKTLIPEGLETINFSVDKVCTLFFYEDKVLRAINSPYEKQVLEIMNGGMMQELLDKNIFIETWFSDIKIKGYNLVLEHKKVSFWNYPYEWSFNMLKDAAETVLTTNLIANKYGYELFDVHAYNVVFDMSTPKYVDFGSFFEIDKNNDKCWSGYLNFYNSFYMPLYLYNKGYSDLSQSILLFNGFFNNKDLFNLKHKYFTFFFGSKISNLIFKGFSNVRKLAVARHFRIIEDYGNHKHINKALKVKKLFQNRYNCKRAFKLIRRIKKSNFDSYWKDYHSSINPNNEKRFVKIKDLIIEKLNDANSIIELASNQGKFAEYVLNETQINKIIATDYDKNAVDKIYIHNKENKQLIPLVYDFVRPNGRICDKKIEERIKADVVMALAVTHHLVLTQDISLQHIFKILKQLTNKYVIVEFMPLGLYSGNMDTIPVVPEYYNLDWFKKEFNNHFNCIFEQEIEINRHLFIGQTKM